MWTLYTPLATVASSLVEYLGGGFDSLESSEDDALTSVSDSVPEDTPSTATAAPLDNRTISTIQDTPPAPGRADISPANAERRVLESKVFFMLTQLSSDTYVSVSDRIVNIVNNSGGTGPRWTLSMVVWHIRRTAMANPQKAELLARLCLRMQEQLSDDVQGEDMLDGKGKTLTGGRLFRAELLNSCAFFFHVRLVALGLATWEDKQDTDPVDTDQADGLDEMRRSTVQEARSQGPGLVRFLGELSKMQLLPLRIVHQCLRELLGGAEKPNLNAVEDACVLLTAVGKTLDLNPKARPFVDACLLRLEGMAKDPSCTLRSRSWINEVVELRARGWVSCDSSQGSAFSGACWSKNSKYKIPAKESDSSTNWRRKDSTLPGDEPPPCGSDGRRVWSNSRLRGKA